MTLMGAGFCKLIQSGRVMFFPNFVRLAQPAAGKPLATVRNWGGTEISCLEKFRDARVNATANTKTLATIASFICSSKDVEQIYQNTPLKKGR